MSGTLASELRKLFEKASHELVPTADRSALELVKSTQDSFGHYQFNGAMKLAKLAKKNPRQLAEEIVAFVQKENNPLIEKLEVAGPGFINIWLKRETLASALHLELIDKALFVHFPKRERIVIDFSSPNTAKEMHVGHLRSTIIGDCLARAFEFAGHDVLRLNHVGDWGTSFGMLIAYLKEKRPDLIKRANQATLSDLMQAYKEAKIVFDSDENFKKRAQQEVIALQNGNPEAKIIWENICEISRRGYQEIYNLLNIFLIERGESFYNPMLAAVVADCEKKGLVTVSDGAKCIFLEGFVNREGEPLPFMIQKSDGGYNYDTTDLAAIRHRIEEEKADRIVYVIDSGQSTHMQMVFKAAEKAGYLDPKKVRVDHVGFGLVLGADGKKFKTRSGDTEKLIDLLNSAVQQADNILQERNPDWNVDERLFVAKALGVAAVKYADLSVNRLSDYAFSYEKMLRFEGNTIAFVMYAYVRSKAILRKVNADIDSLAKTARVDLQAPSEIALGLHLLRFPEMVEGMLQDLLPNRLTDYLYELAEKFNAFFRDCRVEGSKEQDARVLLTELTRRIFEAGFKLLGVTPLERM